MTIIVERMMRAGSFQIDLIDTTPKPVRDQLRAAAGSDTDGAAIPADGHIVITQNRVDEADVVDNIAVAMYRGRLIEQTGSRSFAGRGLASWLGASDAPSPFRPAEGAGGPALTNANLATWIAELVENGITVGTIDEPGGTLTAMWEWSTNIEQLDAVCRSMGAEWMITPDAALHAGAVEDLYPTTPNVIFSDADAGSSADNPAGLRGIRATVLSPTVSSKQRAAITYVGGEGVGTGIIVENSTTEHVANDAAGNVANLYRLVNAPQTATTEALALAETINQLWKNPRTDFSIAVPGDRWRPFVSTGSLAFVHWPEAGILDLSADPFDFDGLTISPRTVRIQQIEWTPSDGDGVYLVRQSGGAVDSVLDLTDWTDLEGGFGKITVGDGNGLAELNQSRAAEARFETSSALADRAAL